MQPIAIMMKPEKKITSTELFARRRQYPRVSRAQYARFNAVLIPSTPDAVPTTCTTGSCNVSDTSVGMKRNIISTIPAP
jgi:hypothetical protein